MDIIANDLVRFEQGIEDYKRSEQKLLENYETLVRHISELNSMWEGNAHQTFVERFKSDSERTLSLINQLENIYNSLHYAHSEYSNCESSIAAIIDELQV